MRQNLPLPMALDCAATDAEYGTAMVLRDIKTWLVKGCSLADSIRRGYPQCPSRALAMVAASEGIGQLSAALSAIETDMKAQAIGPKRLRPIHPFYPVFVVCMVLVLTMGLLTFVMPQFEQVLKEMVEGELPLATRILMQIMRWLTYELYGILLLVLAVLIIKFRFWYRMFRNWVAASPGPRLAWRCSHVASADRARVREGSLPGADAGDCCGSLWRRAGR